MDPFFKFLTQLFPVLADLFRAHAAEDDEARHQAVLRLNRLTSDEIARKELADE